MSEYRLCPGTRSCIEYHYLCSPKLLIVPLPETVCVRLPRVTVTIDCFAMAVCALVERELLNSQNPPAASKPRRITPPISQRRRFDFFLGATFVVAMMTASFLWFEIYDERIVGRSILL